MDEYIKREDALDAVLFALVGTGLQSCAIHAIRDVQTADVVPKSEVERLQEELTKAEADVRNYMKVAEYQQSLSVKRYHEIKRLEEDVDRLQDINNRQVENVRLAKQEVAREIFEEIEKWLVHEYVPYIRGYSNSLSRNFAELKKKYAEGESNG